MRLIAILLAVASITASCALRPTMPPTTASEASGKGAKLFTSRCSTCHRLPHPKRFKYSRWEDTVTRMAGHMEEGLNSPLPPMSVNDKAEILKYLKARSR